MKDPLVRRFISASCFAAAFVWVTVYFFDVETEVVQVLFTFSVIFVLGLIFVGLLLMPLVKLFRGEPTLLSRIQEGEEINHSQEGE